MSKNLNEYYKNYYTDHAGDTYELKHWDKFSRVLTLVEWIKEHSRKGDKILDVGSGDAHLATLLPEYEWHAIDINTEKVLHNNKVEHDLMEAPWPYREKEFDLVVCSEVLEHLHEPLVVHREIKRILKDTGYYLLSTPNHNWIDHHLLGFRQLRFDPDLKHTYEHIKHYDLETHDKLLTMCGFKINRYTGADAQYSGFFSPASEVLQQVFKNLGHDFSQGFVQQIIGAMFKEWNHTIVILATKSKK